MLMNEKIKAALKMFEISQMADYKLVFLIYETGNFGAGLRKIIPWKLAGKG